MSLKSFSLIGPGRYRAIIALASLVSGAVALYLHLWKIGQTSAPLACGLDGGCVRAQMSYYGWFWGIDVALIGAVGYAAILIVAAIGLLPALRDNPWVSWLLMALIWPAVLFTIRLKYGEFVVLRTFCPWCFVNVVTISLNAWLSAKDWVRVFPGDDEYEPDDLVLLGLRAPAE